MLTQEEFSLLNNSELFLTKKRLNAKIIDILGSCAIEIEHQLSLHSEIMDDALRNSRPKISKGENYLSFPWTLLDYPRHFQQEDIFALRTLCWWGNAFSITLHLSGKYAQRFLLALENGLEILAENEFYVCINQQPWQHHFGQDNYRSEAALMTEKKQLQQLFDENKFIKIMKKVPLENYLELPDIAGKTARTIFGILHA